MSFSIFVFVLLKKSQSCLNPAFGAFLYIVDISLNKILPTCNKENMRHKLCSFENLKSFCLSTTVDMMTFDLEMLIKRQTEIKCKGNKGRTTNLKLFFGDILKLYHKKKKKMSITHLVSSVFKVYFYEGHQD